MLKGTDEDEDAAPGVTFPCSRIPEIDWKELLPQVKSSSPFHSECYYC